MRCATLSSLGAGLALSTLCSVPATADWTVAGSGSDMKLTLKSDTAVAAFTQPKLVLLCRDHKPELALVAGLLASRPTVRLDGGSAFAPAFHQRTAFGGWLSDSRKVVEPDTLYYDKAVETIAMFQQHKNMMLFITPQAGPMQQTTFSLGGLSAHLAAFEQACGLREALPRPAAPAEATGALADAASPTPPPTRQPPTEETVGGWTVSRTTSPIDDRPIVMLSLAPTLAPTPATAETSQTRGTLVLRCRERTVAAMLTFDRSLSWGGGSLGVRVSVDNGPTKEWWLRRSTDGRAYFFTAEFQLIKRLLASRELRLTLGPSKRMKGDEWMPEGEALYVLEGLDQASQPLLAACPIDFSRVKVKDGLGPMR